MKQISSYSEFADLCNTAMKSKHRRLTNALLSNELLNAAINDKRLFYTDTGKCSLFVLKRDRAVYLYFYTDSIENVEIPAELSNQKSAIDYYGRTEKPDMWQDVCQRLGFVNLHRAYYWSAPFENYIPPPPYCSRIHL
jgi:hypothetical protein